MGNKKPFHKKVMVEFEDGNKRVVTYDNQKTCERMIRRFEKSESLLNHQFGRTIMIQEIK